MTLAAIKSLALVGAGKMGGALLEGWLANGLDPAAITIIDPTPAPAVAALAKKNGIAMVSGAADLAGCQVVVLAVKPQNMGAVLAGLGGAANAVFLSIAAGQTIADIERGLGHPCAVVRAMPNTPASVGAGISVLVANDRARPARDMCTGLMAAVGAVEWVEDEGLFDAVTALSGSGPAYVFYLVEALTGAGEAAGLPADLAVRLARQTVVGAGALLKVSPLDAAKLRQNVTSKGGTTAAALEVLMEDDALGRLMERAVAAAARRSRDLSG